MNIKVLSLFKDAFNILNHSIIYRAIASEIIKFEAIDIRDYSIDKHKKCDDSPYGGGAGMLMTPQPIFDCIKSVDPLHRSKRIFLSPLGEVFNDKLAQELAKEDDLMFLCGHYEGVDQRVVDLCIDRSISIGDYVLTGGELAAMVVINAISRYVDGVLGSPISTMEESFSNGLLEYHQYTRPEIFENMSVPSVLISGNHSNIAKWRLESSIKNTALFRPDLMKEYLTNKED